MIIESALLPVLPICALAAVIMGVGRLIYLFGAPYADPGAAQTVRRGPGLRTRLLGIAAVALIVGGLLIYGAATVLIDESGPGLLRLGAYLVIIFAAGVALALTGVVLAIQNHLADAHALQSGRGADRGRLWRSNLLEIGLLLGFGAGVLWLTGVRLPDPDAVATFTPDAIERQLLLLRLVAGWTFLAGSSGVILRLMTGIEGWGKTILALIGFSVVNRAFLWVYAGVPPSSIEVRRFAQGKDVESAFAAELLRAETLALIGVALAIVLFAAPLVDLVMKSIAPALKHRFGRMLCFMAVFLVCTGAFVLRDRPAGLAGSAVLADFLPAAAVGIALGVATPLLMAGLKRARSIWVTRAVLGLGVGIAVLAALHVSSHGLAATLLGAAAVLGAGADQREPKAAEPRWAEIF